jgi:c-di-GMP-binding flagellar brake protein YcgR
MEKKKNIGIERRRFQRFGCCMPAQCKQLGNIRDDILGALTKDVSEGGTRLVTHNFIPVNSRIVLVLSFPLRNQSVKIVSKVVWTRRFETLSRYDLGIEFIDMTSKGRGDISFLLKSKVLD